MECDILRSTLLALSMMAIGIGKGQTAISASASEGDLAEFPDIGTVSTDIDDIRFFLFSLPSHTNQPEEIIYQDLESLTSSAFNPSKPTKICIHGFNTNGLGNSGFSKYLKDEYLKKYAEKEWNIISVDWGKLVSPVGGQLSTFFYPFAVANVERAGQRIADFVIWINETYGLEINLVHLVGFSLGVHAAGWAGYLVNGSKGTKVGRITALDAGAPEFYTGLLARRIQPSDAEFTDAYHTTSATNGLPMAIGHVDFYINGGYHPQPGCFFQPIGCSHRRAYEYFGLSITLGDPATHSDATVCVCISGLNFVTDPSCCNLRLLFGEYCKPETVGRYFVGYNLP